MRLKNLFLLVIVQVLLFGCRSAPFPVDFATSPGILRGTWLGAPNTDSTPTSRLELTATYVNETTYNVTGTIQSGTNPPLSLIGRTYTFNIRYIKPQTSVPDPSEIFIADIKNENGEVVQQLCLIFAGGAYTGFIGVPNSFERSADGSLICDDETNTGKQPIILRKSS